MASWDERMPRGKSRPGQSTEGRRLRLWPTEGDLQLCPPWGDASKDAAAATDEVRDVIKFMCKLAHCNGTYCSAPRTELRADGTGESKLGRETTNPKICVAVLVERPHPVLARSIVMSAG